jgi:hypothetical protein
VAFDLGFLPNLSSVNIAADCYMNVISSHMLSYERVSCPYVTYDLPKVVMSTQQFTKYSFYLMTGFWPEKVSAISVALASIPDMIQCQKTRCAATKERAIFLLLWRWHLPTSWEIVSKDMRQQHSWCILIYYELFFLLAQHYRKLVRVLDNGRILLPLLESWGVQMNEHCGTNQSAIPLLSSLLLQCLARY